MSCDVCVQCCLKFITCLQGAEWQLRWHWKYSIQKEPYDEDAKQHLTRQALKLSETRWEALEDSQRQDMLSKELWVKGNCEVCLHPAVKQQ